MKTAHAEKPDGAKAKSGVGPVRTLKFEIVGLSGEVRDQLEMFSMRMAQVSNLYMIAWMQHHHHAGSLEKVWQASERYRERSKDDSRSSSSKRKDDNPLGISPKEAIPAEVGVNVVKECRERFGMIGDSLSSIVRVLEGVLRGQASCVKMPVWWAILSGRMSLPSFEREIGVMFRRHGQRGTQLIPPDDAKGDWVLSVRSPLGGGRIDIKLATKKRKVSSQVRWLHATVKSEVEPLGIRVIRRDGKWFACVSYRRFERERPVNNPDRVAYLAPGDDVAWMLRVSDEDFVRDKFAKSAGDMILNQRERLARQEQSRVIAKKYGGESVNGHGREKATRGLQIPRLRYRGIVDSYVRVMASRIAAMSAAIGVGKVVFLRPEADDKAFLSMSEFPRWEGFQWFIFGEKLKNAITNLDVVIEFADRKIPKLLSRDEMLSM